MATDTAFADLDYARPLPQDPNAERAVLGALLLKVESAKEVLDQLETRDFYEHRNGLIFDVVLDLYTAGTPVDAITVAAALAKTGDLNRVGAHPYLHALINSAPAAASGSSYAEIVKEQAVLRRLVETGQRFIQMGHSTDGSDAAKILAAAEQELAAVVADASTTVGTSALDAVCPDLGPYLDGTFTAPEPTIGFREDKAPLFYAGEINRVFGKSESGKTWLTLLCGLQHLQAGGHFVFCDYENGPAGVIPRLLNLGAPRELLTSGRFRYLDLRDTMLTADMRTAIVKAHTNAVVVIDSVAGLITSNAKSSNYVDDVEALLTRDMAVLTRAGCSLIFIDHESDRGENGGRSSGSHRKRDLISGVSFRVEPSTPFQKWSAQGAPDGRSRVYVDKDRHGSVRAASVRVAGDRDHFGDLALRPYQDGSVSCKLWWPEVLAPETEKTPEHYARVLIDAGFPEGHGRDRLKTFIAERELKIRGQNAFLNEVLAAIKTLRQADPK